jgi:FkbM family methyltransferase
LGGGAARLDAEPQRTDVVALADFGDTRREFGRGIGWPLGVNMAVRASVFHTNGVWWDNRYDRVGNSLRGQGQREWCIRVRAAGLHGYYTPDMIVHHLVPADRMRKPYFRRWFYWYGISRAVLYAQHGLDMESPDEQTFDFSAVRHVAGVCTALHVSERARSSAQVARRSGRSPYGAIVRARAVALFLRRHSAAAMAGPSRADRCRQSSGGDTVTYRASASPIRRHDPREQEFPFEPDGLRNRALTKAAQWLSGHGMLWRANFAVSGRLAGRPLRVPLEFGSGWEHLRMREVWLYHALQRVMAERRGAVVDVGVNVGHTLVKIKTADPEREYIGIEPNPQCLQYTRHLIDANGFQRCTLVPVAISNRSGLLKLLQNSDVDPSATIVEGFREPTRYERSTIVPVLPGDEVMDTLNVGDIAAIKIDVEGGELDVIQGLERTLRRTEPHIFCEVLPVFDERSEMGRFRLRRQTTLRAVLGDLGYAIFRADADQTMRPVDDFGVHADMTLANYMFVPRSAVGHQLSAVS